MVDFTGAMQLALSEARKFIGATAPNPPVGAAVLDSEGRVLAVAAHQKAGTAHAEAKALEICERLGILDQAHTIVVTLEPCNHHGRTPPCTAVILRAKIKHVVMGARDPNPVARGGVEALRAAGVQVTEGVLRSECEELLLPFTTRMRTGFPFITVKTAHSREGTMVPPSGEKTFTSMASLKLAHELRKQSDAILTGSGTVLADFPHFTVRHVEDHPGKRRWLIVMDRRERIPADWLADAAGRGFQPLKAATLDDAFRLLGEKGCLSVLVEAGPELSQAVLEGGYWDCHYRIRQGAVGEPDRVEILANDNRSGMR